MLRLNKLTIARGAKVLLKDANLTIFPGEHIGLVGENGAGKSSLFAAIRHEMTIDAGDIDIPGSWRTAHVAQETPALADTALDFVLQGDEPLQAIQDQIAQAESDGRHELLGELHAQLADIDGYAARSRAAALLHGLGFNNDDLVRPVSDFSGGWRVRLNLARALGSRAELLLLDEPTNHLDIEAVLWLEQWLVKTPATLIIISHDRQFLDDVATHTVSLAHGQLVKYSGGYSQYERQSAEQLRQQSGAIVKQRAEAEKLQRFVDRFRAQATKAKQAQSRLKRLDKMEAIVAVRPPLPVDFEFLQPTHQPDPIITLVDASCGYNPEAPILQGITQEIRSGQRIGLLGQNGNGKSTLIKSLVGDLNLLAGDKHLGKGTVFGYFAQHQVDTLRDDDTPLSHFRRLAPQEREQNLRNFLGRFGFSGIKVEQVLGSLSGGEKARLALAGIIWQRPNILLLDEPTNHLDLLSREALAEALFEFAGALIVVSHDRHLLESTTDQYWRVHAGRVSAFDGDLDDYHRRLNDERLAAAGEDKRAAKPTHPVKTGSVHDKKQFVKQLTQLDKKIAMANQRLAEIDAALLAAASSNTASGVFQQEREALTQSLIMLEESWLECQLKIDSCA
jgi:ATP-binding cassette subfamily F protein 3